MSHTGVRVGVVFCWSRKPRHKKALLRILRLMLMIMSMVNVHFIAKIITLLNSIRMHRHKWSLWVVWHLLEYSQRQKFYIFLTNMHKCKMKASLHVLPVPGWVSSGSSGLPHQHWKTCTLVLRQYPWPRFGDGPTVLLSWHWDAEWTG